MKHNAIVGNIGHFDNEIDMAGLKKIAGIKKINIKPQYDEWVFPDGHSVLVLAEGRLLNLGCATGHPSFVMSASFTNQVLAQLELHDNAEKIGMQVLMLPKKLDEEVARLHLDQLGVKLHRAVEGAGGVHRRAGGRSRTSRSTIGLFVTRLQSPASQAAGLARLRRAAGGPPFGGLAVSIGCSKRGRTAALIRGRAAAIACSREAANLRARRASPADCWSSLAPATSPCSQSTS